MQEAGLRSFDDEAKDNFVKFSLSDPKARLAYAMACRRRRLSSSVRSQ